MGVHIYFSSNYDVSNKKARVEIEHVQQNAHIVFYSIFSFGHKMSHFTITEKKKEIEYTVGINVGTQSLT